MRKHEGPRPALCISQVPAKASGSQFRQIKAVDSSMPSRSQREVVLGKPKGCSSVSVVAMEVYMIVDRGRSVIWGQESRSACCSHNWTLRINVLKTKRMGEFW